MKQEGSGGGMEGEGNERDGWNWGALPGTMKTPGNLTETPGNGGHGA